MNLQLDEHGVEIKTKVVATTILEAIKDEISQAAEDYPAHGIRGADKKFQSIGELTQSGQLLALAADRLGSPANVVRVIFFDKTADKNWLVTWHQDKTIAVNKRLAIEGWGPWSVKDAVHHVQPPLAVLNTMLTFRLHLDDTDENNGCLKVIPGSHQLGILSQQQLTEVVNSQAAYLCEVAQGDLLIMRPHLLHASSKAINPGHRRVVHIEYSNYQLPAELQWA